MSNLTSFEQLREAVGEITDIGHANALLSWDQQTYMPPRGAAARGQQIATLSAIAHERMTSPRLGDLLARARQETLTTDQKRLIELVEWSRDRALKLPATLVRELALQESASFEVWRGAKREKNFALFAPQLRRLLYLVQQKAQCYGFEETPWDALVPDYEKGCTAASLRETLAPLRRGTVALLDRIRGAAPVEDGFLNGRWDVAQQREFGLRVARDFGYDMARGRLDVTAHPFCTTIAHGEDVRITTRYREDALLDSVMGILHETGHALFEQGFRPEDARTPLADSPSMGTHESQSRFWEIRIGQSRPFWEHYLPVLRQHFPGQLDGVTPEQLYRAINKVQPDLIRVEADEVTYNLHIIIRFDIEVDLLSGELDLEDLPEAWNARYKSDLGVTVPHDGVGCLQDVHWAYGSFGYFPTYSLGNLYAAMFVEKMERDLPGLWRNVRRGDFSDALFWLRTHIHREGARREGRDLIEAASGQKLSADPLLRYFEAKYKEVYAL